MVSSPMVVSHRHICAIPHFATYRAILVRYPTRSSTKEFCDTIVASIARYEKYRYWASKPIAREETTSYSTIGFRGKLFLRYAPCKACLWIAKGHFYGKKYTRCNSDSLRQCDRGIVTPVSRGGGVFRSGH